MSDPVVFLPPMLCDARVYAHQLAALSRSRSVMVAPTHLSESSEDMAQIVLAALPRRFALVGGGYGARVALEIARAAPERMAQLSLIGATVLASTPQEASAREPMIIAARMGRMEDVLAHELPPGALAETARRPQVLAMMREMGGDLGADAFATQSRAMQRSRDHSATLRQLTQKVLIIGGESDPIYPPKRQIFMAELAPDGEVEIITGAGHLPTLEQPEAVTDRLTRWLNQPLILK